jgi:RNA polymerase sigma-70 factor (ECF subfamily)
MKIIDRLCAARALKGLIAERRGRLYKVAYAWCGERHLADDLVQEAMTRAMGKCHQLRDPTRLDSWLYSILNNCWREHLRGQRADFELDDDTLACTRCPERLNLSGELAQRVFELMNRLPEGQRQVLSLVALEEFSYREVAETLDIPIGTVMSRLSRARRFLADQIGAATAPPRVSRPYLRRVK